MKCLFSSVCLQPVADRLLMDFGALSLSLALLVMLFPKPASKLLSHYVPKLSTGIYIECLLFRLPKFHLFTPFSDLWEAIRQIQNFPEHSLLQSEFAELLAEFKSTQI